MIFLHPLPPQALDRSEQTAAALDDDLASLADAPPDADAARAGRQRLDLLRSCHAADSARLRFLLKAYHRVRLGKIEAQWPHLLDHPPARARLSRPERAFLRTFGGLMARHLTEAVGEYLPQGYGDVFEGDAPEDGAGGGAARGPAGVPRPRLSTSVVARCVVDLPEGVAVAGPARAARTGEATATGGLREGDVVVVPLCPPGLLGGGADRDRTALALVRSGKLRLL